MIKNYKVGLRYLFDRTVGRNFKKYAPEKEMISYLNGIIPAFLKEKAAPGASNKKLLLVSMGYYDVKTEGIYAKSLEKIGFTTYVLASYSPYISRLFRIFGIDKMTYYEDYYQNIALAPLMKEAEQKMSNVAKDTFLKIVRNGIQIGKYAASSYMRMTRESSIDLESAEKKKTIQKLLAFSIRAAINAEQIINEIKPDIVFVVDRGYTPVGQLFDCCLNKGIPVITRNASYKSGSEVLKKYLHPDMGSIHPYSLSEESWDYLKKIPWQDEIWEKTDKELKDTYTSGDWFSEVGTQFDKIVYSKKELMADLQLDPARKTAVIFPHMFWDATFFYGQDLFEDYYDWYVHVLKIAAGNKNLNWIVKIHPANIVKAKRDNYSGAHRELTSIKETLGEVPGHIKIIPPESNINTYSFFTLMDYCLTVRGTIGIEAAAYGINTLTAGTGRYDKLGFTYDFDNKESYLRQIAQLHKLPPMNKDMIELARRYAYGIFVLRPIHLDLLEHGYNKDEKVSMKFKPLFSTREEFARSKFVKGFKQFVLSKNEDYLSLE